MSKRLAAATVLVLALVLTTSALAGTNKPAADGSPPGISQYVEVIPTAGGATPADGRTKSSSPPLSPKAATSLTRAGGSDAALLEKIATSTGYGAPARKPHTSTRGSGAVGGGAPTKARASAAPPIVAVTDTSYSSRSWWVLTLLTVIALGGVVAAVIRTRRRAT